MIKGVKSDSSSRYNKISILSASDMILANPSKNSVIRLQFDSGLHQLIDPFLDIICQVYTTSYIY